MSEEDEKSYFKNWLESQEKRFHCGHFGLNKIAFSAFLEGIKYITLKSNDIDKPKIVVLCGSSKFVEIMAVAQWLIERDELAITMGLNLLPQWYPNCPPDHLAEHEGCASLMDELHLRKIDISDEIFVVDWDNYIGDSTSNEIKYAEKKGKRIRYFSSDIIGQQVCKLIVSSNGNVLL